MTQPSFSTPTENVVAQQGDSPNAVVVRRHGEDHGSYYGKLKFVESYLSLILFKFLDQYAM